MKPYEWMVTYTPQKEWIQGSGMVVWLSFYAGLLGSGSYLVSLYLNSFIGMFISWLIVLILKNAFHVVHAKNPLRLWRMILKPKTSWIARGTISTFLFSAFGMAQLACTYFATGTVFEIVFKVLAGLTALAIIIYEGFTLNVVTAIPFWNSAVLPALFITWGILNGLSLVLAIGLYYQYLSVYLAFLIATVILTILYLSSANNSGAAARASVKEITSGSLSLVFIIGTALIGSIIPLIVLLYSYFGSYTLSQALAVLLFICELIGGLTFTYIVFKAGKYNPLVY